ncbi:MAG: alanine racemase, partial [Brachybacterium sp.]|nr:alanine racemase [Brachybacterium sp.]
MSAGRGAVDPAQEPRPGFFAVLENALAAAEVEERPVAVLDLDAFDANLDALVRRAGGIPVRIASKSVRVRALMDRALTHPGVRGVLAYTLPEALHLAAGGIRDIVVAYPSVDARALRTLAADDDARERITVMVDEVAHLELLRAITADVLPPGARLRVALELDVSYAPLPGVRFGALRSPCRTPEGLRGLAREVLDRPELHLRGIMAYEGQIAGVGNAGRGPYPLAVRAMQALSAREIAHRRAAAVAAIRELTELEFVNGGGTGSMETTAAEAAVT